jgi:uncharacterized protein (DUF58 family)
LTELRFRADEVHVSLRLNALLLAVLSTLLGILGEWSGTPVLRHLWALPAGLLLLGLALEGILLTRCTVRLTLHGPERWAVLRRQPVTFAFSQEGRRTLSVEVALTVPEQFAAQPRIERLTLQRPLESRLRLEAAPRRLGHYSWPAPPMRIGGLLGLAWWSRVVETSLAITVVPDLVGRFEQQRAEQAGGATLNRVRGAGAEVLQLREYQASDPMRAIDWKASARRGRLISRELSEDQHLEIVVAIDAGRASGLGAGETDRLSLYATITARLAQRATELDDAVGLLIFAAQPLVMLAPARGDRAVARINELLTACRVQPSESNPIVAAARIRSTVQRRSLVVLLTDLEDFSAGEQLARAVRVLTPKHLPFIATPSSDRIASLPSARVREALGAYRALAALEYTDALEGNVRALRALGAAAVMARPEELHRAVLEAYQGFRDRRRI